MEACEIWIYRSMLKIPWTARMKNSEVLEMAKTESMVPETIKSRKIKYFGHVIRGEKYKLLRLIIQGKIEGKRGAGRRKTSEWTGISTVGELEYVLPKTEIFNSGDRYAQYLRKAF
jgi:hypothetical protein